MPRDMSWYPKHTFKTELIILSNLLLHLLFSIYVNCDIVLPSPQSMRVENLGDIFFYISSIPIPNPNSSNQFSNWLIVLWECLISFLSYYFSLCLLQWPTGFFYRLLLWHNPLLFSQVHLNGESHGSDKWLSIAYKIKYSWLSGSSMLCPHKLLQPWL